MVKVIFCSILAALFFALIQASVLSNLTILPAIPDLVLLLVLYVSLKNGGACGCTSGFLSGIIMDFASASPLGLNAITKTIAGFVTGKFNPAFMQQKFFVPVAVAIGSTLLKAILMIVLAFFFGDKIIRYGIVSSMLWFEVAANAICAPFMFMLLNAFKPLFIMKGVEDQIK